MLIGKVKWFDTKKGFGFLTGDDGLDIFVHYSSIEGDGFRRLYDGEEVEFELTNGPKGFNAAKVRRINAPSKANAIVSTPSNPGNI